MENKTLLSGNSGELITQLEQKFCIKKATVYKQLLDQICDRFDYAINIEYAVSVSNWLKGSLDYYIPSPSNFLVIEAKQSDLTKGFTQLAVEKTMLS